MAFLMKTDKISIRNITSPGKSPAEEKTGASGKESSDMTRGNGSTDDFPKKKHSGSAAGTLAHLIEKGIRIPQQNTTDKNEVQKETPSNVNHEVYQQEDANQMEQLDNLDKDSAGTDPEKKSGLKRRIPWIIVLAGLVFSVLWYTGVQFSNNEERTPIDLRESKPDLESKKILRPIKKPETASVPVKELPLPPDSQPAGEEVEDPKDKDHPTLTVETPPPAPLPSPMGEESLSAAPAGPVENRPYALHVGSFKTMGLAEKSIEEFKEKGFSPYWVKVDLGEKGVWFRVFVGHFKDVEQAKEFQKNHEIKVDRILKPAYAVQIGEYVLAKELNRKVDALKETGLCPYTIIKTQNRYQILVGAYQTQKAAKQLAARLASTGLDCKVVLK